MAASPSPLPMMASQSLGDPSTQLPPLANSLVAGQTPPPQSLPQQPAQPSPQQSASYRIDPKVLDRPVKIRIDGSSRMLTKDILSQVVQFYLPIIGNGPFLQQLMMSGQTIDFPKFFEMVQEATGTKRLYPIVRPLNQQEEQRLGQPPPQVRAQMQMKQQEGQTRKDIMQMKVEADKEKTASAERTKMHQISEESARHIIEQILNEGGPMAKMMEARLKAQQGQQQMHLKMAQGRQEMQQKHVEHLMDMQHQARQHAADLQMQRNQMGLDMLQQRNQMGMDAQRAHLDNQMAQANGMAKMQQILSTGKAKKDAAEMQPKKAKSSKRDNKSRVNESPRRA